MKRDKAILLHYQKAPELSVSKKFYRDHITELFEWMIKADAVSDDVTSKTLKLKGKGKTEIVTRQVGIIAGLEELKELLAKNTKLVFKAKVSDGTRVGKDQVVGEVLGDNTEILAYERTIVNILGRMSGVATETDVLVSLIKKAKNTPFIAAIRKTPLMMIDKKAVAVGGGLTHRLNLSDEILIKDNHLGMLQKESGLESSEKTAEEAVKRCMQSKKDYFEIEVDTLAQANAILHTFVKENDKLKKKKMMTILLDNFKPVEATKFVTSLKKLPVYDSVLIEASGEINAKNLSEWATTGVDVVSLGSLTHSPKVFNFSMQY
jgi:nicotinate-nucleotide pyrophosphorylase (carboxylating)